MDDSRVIVSGVFAAIVLSCGLLTSNADEPRTRAVIEASFSDEPAVSETPALPEAVLPDAFPPAAGLRGGGESSVSASETERQGATVPGIKPLGAIRLVREMTSRAGNLSLPADASRTYVPTELPVDSPELTPWVFYPHPSPQFPVTYNPLYFEDPNLERCGNACGPLTDGASIVRFGGRIPLLPYLMATHCPDSRVHALRDCPTCRRYTCEDYIPKPTVLPVTVQGVAVIGLIFIVP